MSKLINPMHCKFNQKSNVVIFIRLGQKQLNIWTALRSGLEGPRQTQEKYKGSETTDQASKFDPNPIPKQLIGDPNGRTDGRMDGRTSSRGFCISVRPPWGLLGWWLNPDGRTDGRTGGQTDGRTDRRTDRQTGGQTDGRTDGPLWDPTKVGKP